jgi:hypothetical protein
MATLGLRSPSSRASSFRAAPPVIESGAMSTDQVVFIPQCAECGERRLPDDEERWRAYLDTDSEIVFYCSECAEREFGEWR